MKLFSRSIQVRWSDLDPNFHLRHSAYYDYGAFCRIEFFNQYGLTAHFMQQHGFGPVLFREEALFKREIQATDTITIDMHLLKSTEDYGRWTLQHHLYKNTDTLAAVITVDGAWLNTQKRKLTTPPATAQQTFAAIEKSEAFSWTTN
ncbi:MAG: hypothetical protein RLZZ316_425 [Bacteroidota bacterium]|jgi:acyl-CoA thioester hydrolase